MTNYPGGQDLIGPIKGRMFPPLGAFMPDANRTW